MLVPESNRYTPYRSTKLVTSQDMGESSASDDDSAGPARRCKAEPVARMKLGRGPLQHNEVEKRRRAYLSSCYIELKALLPSISEIKASNVAILRTAVEQIKELESTERNLCEERDALYRQRKQLLAKKQRRQAVQNASYVLSELMGSVQQCHARTLSHHHDPYSAAETMASSDDSFEMLVPDSEQRSLSPNTEDDMAYDFNHIASDALSEHDVRKLGGGAIRRRSHKRPSRFML